MTEQEERELEVLVNERLNNQRSIGMTAGATAICSVILDKAIDNNMNDRDKLKEIISFCKISLGNKN